MNNCVGLENYRFFLLFILYLMIGAIWFLVSIISIWNHYIYVSPFKPFIIDYDNDSDCLIPLIFAFREKITH